MAEYFKREIADLNETGKKQYRYELRSRGSAGLKALARQVHKRYRMLDATELEGIAEDFIDEMAALLTEGYSVTLGNLGSFSLSIGLIDKKHPEQTEDEAEGEPNARSLYVRGINFKANKRYVSDINNKCHLQRESGGTAHLHPSPYSLEQRIARAVSYIRQNGFLRIANYAGINGISISAASRELRQLDGTPDFPLRSDGRGPSKVYRMKQEPSQE